MRFIIVRDKYHKDWSVSVYTSAGNCKMTPDHYCGSRMFVKDGKYIDPLIHNNPSMKYNKPTHRMYWLVHTTNTNSLMTKDFPYYIMNIRLEDVVVTKHYKDFGEFAGDYVELFL